MAVTYVVRATVDCSAWSTLIDTMAIISRRINREAKFPACLPLLSVWSGFPYPAAVGPSGPCFGSERLARPQRCFLFARALQRAVEPGFDSPGLVYRAVSLLYIVWADKMASTQT